MDAAVGAGPAAIELAELAGLYLDEWQQLVLCQMLAERDVWYYNAVLEREMRTFAAFEVGLTEPRQNGKGACVEARELAGLFLLGEEMIIHSAHEFPTSEQHFHRVASLIENTPQLSRELKSGGIKVARGAEGIYLKSGQSLVFKTRTKNGVRGFSGDCIVLDEAMSSLGTSEVGALFPTLSARPNPQVIYTASAGNKDSEQLGAVRARALKAIKDPENAEEPRLSYMEWSIDAHTDMCPPGCRDHDRSDITADEARTLSEGELDIAVAEMVESYRKANPGLGIRITVEHVENERRTMPAEAFARERLGVGDWPQPDEAWRVIDLESWNARIDKASAPQSPLVISVDTTPDCAYSCIAVAGYNGETVGDARQVHVEVTQSGIRYDHRPGTRWVIPRLREIIANNGPRALVIDKGTQAGVFVDEIEATLTEFDVTLLTPTMREHAQACGMFRSACIPGRDNAPYLVHMDQPMLNVAVAGADKRELAALWAWNKRGTAIDISPLVACTNALWGVHKIDAEPPPAKPWISY